MSGNILEVKDLYKSYGPVEAVKGISFNVREGTLFAFLGLNGAGKSTTINMISGILSKDKGHILLDNESIEKNLLKAKGKIGIVFQNSVLDKKLSVYSNLKTRAALYDISGELFKVRIEELSTLLDMEEILKRPIGKLSGGQRRKADIARALIHNPKLLILDEPTTGLDPQTRILVWNCLEALRKNTGLTIFLTTHYMEEASEADHVIILDDGEIVASDSPNALKNQYANDFIKIYSKGVCVYNIIKKENLIYCEKDELIEINIKNTKEATRLITMYPDAFNDFEVVKGKMDDVFLKVTGKNLKGDDLNE